MKMVSRTNASGPWVPGSQVRTTRALEGTSSALDRRFQSFWPAFAGACLLMILSSCLLPRIYEPPPGSKDRALLKFRFSLVRPIPGADLYRQVWITTEESAPSLALDAYRTRLGDPEAPLEIEGVFVLSEESILVRMELFYKWELKMLDHDPIYRFGPRQARPHWVSRERRRGCRAEIEFTPGKNTSYLLDFTAISTETCQIKAYEMFFEEETREAGEGGSFRLKEVGQAQGREILDDSPLDWGNFEFDSGF